MLWQIITAMSEINAWEYVLPPERFNPKAAVARFTTSCHIVSLVMMLKSSASPWPGSLHVALQINVFTFFKTLLRMLCRSGSTLKVKCSSMRAYKI
jgi:hypothetical protein